MSDNDFKKPRNIFDNKDLIRFQQKMLPNLYWYCNLANTSKQFQIINAIQSNITQFESIRKSIQNSVLFSSAYLDSLKMYRASLYEVSDLSKIMSIYSLSQKMQSSFSFNFSELIKTQEKISQMYGSSIFINHHLASERILDSIASLQAAIKVFNFPNELMVRSLEISNSYQYFAKKQYKYAEKNESLTETVLTVTDYAGDMVVSINSAVELGCESLINSSEFEAYNGGVLLSNRTNIFPMLNLHLSYLYRSDTQNTNIACAIENSMPAIINRLGCQIIELVFRINSYIQGIDGSYIFTISNNNFYGASVLPSLIAINETQFAEIIDHLFFLLYEGSGSAKRLLAISDDTQLNPIWIIKHLRLGFRHDLEHGDQIEKKLKKCGDAFRELIGKSKPLNTIDWKRAQAKIYHLVVIMLSKILINLEKNEDKLRLSTSQPS